MCAPSSKPVPAMAATATPLLQHHFFLFPLFCLQSLFSLGAKYMTLYKVSQRKLSQQSKLVVRKPISGRLAKQVQSPCANLSDSSMPKDQTQRSTHVIPLLLAPTKAPHLTETYKDHLVLPLLSLSPLLLSLSPTPPTLLTSMRFLSLL